MSDWACWQPAARAALVAYTRLLTPPPPASIHFTIFHSHTPATMQRMLTILLLALVAAAGAGGRACVFAGSSPLVAQLVVLIPTALGRLAGWLAKR